MGWGERGARRHGHHMEGAGEAGVDQIHPAIARCSSGWKEKVEWEFCTNKSSSFSEIWPL